MRYCSATASTGIQQKVQQQYPDGIVSAPNCLEAFSRRLFFEHTRECSFCAVLLLLPLYTTVWIWLHSRTSSSSSSMCVPPCASVAPSNACWGGGVLWSPTRRVVLCKAAGDTRQETSERCSAGHRITLTVSQLTPLV